jgi:DNA polymerase-3 subunit gamma/tau
LDYQPLHHKYRPQTFAGLVGQQAIAATLTKAIERERIAPAYLFTGSRGTGKTSSARILAKSLNCIASPKPTPTPCGKCEVCRSIANGTALDVIEIDAASNTGVDNIREIIERSHFAPVQCRYKVYAIDEVHGLTSQAFNALLKTLEEPPDRVVFILATTDPQRVLPTIISRCQRFDFRRIPQGDMVAHLAWIARQEKIAITDEALHLVAQVSQGGLRDAESLLDQLSLLHGEITPEQVWELIGAVAELELLELLEAIANQDSEAVISLARHLMDRGKEPLIVLQNFAGFLRDLLIAKAAPQSPNLVALTGATWQRLVQAAQNWSEAQIIAGSKYLRDSETQIKHSTQPRLWLEVTLLGLLAQFSVTTIPPVVKVPGDSEVITPTPKATIPEADSVAPETGADDPPEVDENNEIWQEVLERTQMLATQAFLRQHCKLLDFDGVEAIVGVTNEKLLSTAKRKLPEVQETLSRICDRQIIVTLEVIGQSTGSPTTPKPSPPTYQSSRHSQQPPNLVKEERLAQPTPTYQDSAPNQRPVATMAESKASPAISVLEIEPVIPPPPIAPEVVEPTGETDQVQTALQKISHFFEGTIIELDSIF